MSEPAPRPRHGRGIRGRVAIATAGILAAAFAVGLVVFTNLVTFFIAQDLSASLTTETDVVVDALSAEGPRALVGIDPDDTFLIQFVGPGGNLIYTSNVKTITEPLTTLRPGPGERSMEGLRRWWSPWDGDLPLIVEATGFAYEGNTYTVVVATSQDHVQQSVSSMATAMGVAAPLLILVGAALSRGVVTRALRPVEVIRTRVETVSASNLSERVQVAPTGDEIEALGETMNRMLARLEAARNSQRRFVADASHELRSPMSSLRGALEIAVRSGRLETWTDMAPLLTSETTRIQETVSDLLLLSRIDDQGLTLDFADVDLDDVTLAEASDLRARSGRKVLTRIAPVRLLADPARLRHVIRNLADNAARHARSTVLITVAGVHATAVLTVADDGDGIHPDDRVRVFERFVRLDESRSRDGGGSGLGLAIVRELVLAHGGTISVGESAELGGAEFTVRLPMDSPYRA